MIEINLFFSLGVCKVLKYSIYLNISFVLTIFLIDYLLMSKFFMNIA